MARPVAEIRITQIRKLLIIKTEVLDKWWLTPYGCAGLAVARKWRLAQQQFDRIIAAQSDHSSRALR